MGEEEGPPVASLEQLFGQAACARVLIKKKALDLATASGGCFPAVTRVEGKELTTFVPAASLEPDAATHKVRWPPVKSLERSLEKLLRSHDGDVSRLLDCCRLMLVFDHVSQLVACLDAVSQDPQLHVMRIKNRLRLGDDAYLTGGFRYAASTTAHTHTHAHAAGCTTACTTAPRFATP